ncbi:MAG: tRNA uridine-5-carboxymethylaminomethyl(34) synthesis enzyme MnmG [Synergistaceae bacterium]|jgi:tRNA uridine 5-carboxymethylaminomethyl modification enzyme|nr:tRNA uridine-5-carboxymethylaminomethyl(34) synthesis enzyme MnmG [Synergistaceae bacterium]
MNQNSNFDVVVIGGGHSGCEAALAASRMGFRTLLLNHNIDNTALMPCNPAIGGPAKGNLVRELDALGGEQAIAADFATLHLRWLNTSKGFAVRTLRAQCDLKDYASHYARVLAEVPGLFVYQAMAAEIAVDSGRVSGVVTRTGEKFGASRVILASGTYMRGVVHMGMTSFPSGPLGQVPSPEISDSLARAGIELRRFRTDTTPRICRHSVDWDALPLQPGDPDPEAFSHWRPKKLHTGYFCGQTRTSAKTHDILRAALGRSPLATKKLDTAGPRYCPSIDDKILKFPDKESHPIFLEPVGRSSREIYMQNFSTTSPPDVQIEMIHTLPGCERALMIRPGYGIEYDYVNPEQLEPWLETRRVRGLYCAGQICGTSGYEEAAAQGMMAGINAALSLRGQEPLVLGRGQAYIGVLIDDLTTRGTDEPYRMLPSRCEHRLLMRHDNADDRLCLVGREVGLLSAEKWAVFEARKRAIELERERLAATRVPVCDRTNAILREMGSSPLAEPLSAMDLLLRPEVSWGGLLKLIDSELAPDLGAKIEIDAKYAGYAQREERRVRRLSSMERLRIPDEMEYGEIPGLSAEASEKLSRVRPRTLGQASRIPGVNNVDLQLVQVAIERSRRLDDAGRAESRDLPC